MGWLAFTIDGELRQEGVHGRPVQEGEEGKLLVIAQEDFGHRIAVDLTHGLIFIDYETLGVQNGTVEISGFKTMFYICDETNRLADVEDEVRSEFEDELLRSQGWVKQDYVPLTWRPIWFTRLTNGQPTKCIGAQTTLFPGNGGRNVTKLISMFDDGTLGID